MAEVKKKTFIQRLVGKNRLSQFLISVSFLITFGIVRIITHLQRAGVIPEQHGVLHIHHLVPGIILLLISGYIGISFWNHPRVKNSMSILYGIGAALTIDEFALWLYLKDVYWEKQGRDSIDAAIILIVIFAIIFIISDVYDYYLLKRMKQ